MSFLEGRRENDLAKNHPCEGKKKKLLSNGLRDVAARVNDKRVGMWRGDGGQ
jgi:hypothetical protein